MKKVLFLASLLAISTMSFGCGDESEDNGKETGAKVRCNVNSAGFEFAEKNVNGVWTVSEQCSDKTQCVNGACVAADKSCSDSVSVCVDASDVRGDKSGNVLKSCEGGKQVLKNCVLSGEVCFAEAGGARCVASTVQSGNACHTGEERCNAQGMHEYCAFGQWVNDPCESGVVCANNKCGGTTSCKNGLVKCKDKDAYTCEEGNWVVRKSCPNSCFQGVCDDEQTTTNPLCNDAGTDCKAGHSDVIGMSTYLSMYSIGCGTINGRDYDAECAAKGELCLSEDGGPRGCVKKCTVEGDKSSSCDRISGATYYNEYTCSKIDDQWVMFNSAYVECGKSADMSGMTEAERNCAKFGPGWGVCEKYDDYCNAAKGRTGMQACCAVATDTIMISCLGGEDEFNDEYCLFYDCASKQSADDESKTVGEVCADRGENMVAICDGTSAYCVEHVPEADRECGAGYKALKVGSELQCIYIGASDACLVKTCDKSTYIETCSGSKALWCSNDGIVYEYNCAQTKQECLIYEEGGKRLQECVSRCEASEVGKESYRCVDSIYGSFAYVDICTKVGDAYYKLPHSTQCKKSCDVNTSTCAK